MAQIDIINHTIVTIPQLAKRLNISPATAWRWVLTKKIPSFKMGSVRRTSLEAVQAALTAYESDIESECREAGI